MATLQLGASCSAARAAPRAAASFRRAGVFAAPLRAGRRAAVVVRAGQGERARAPARVGGPQRPPGGPAGKPESCLPSRTQRLCAPGPPAACRPAGAAPHRRRLAAHAAWYLRGGLSALSREAYPGPWLHIFSAAARAPPGPPTSATCKATPAAAAAPSAPPGRPAAASPRGYRAHFPADAAPPCSVLPRPQSRARRTWR
jgi:hypothetical protein